MNYDFNHVNEAAQKDILELDRRIQAFRSGKEDEERFKLYRLTRGVYGQRQFGVQMFRTKIPYGKLTTDQLIRIADVSEKYTNGNLHLTTRQNIQLHYVKLEDSPKIWTELAQTGITAREACGNTVRNLTASANAGIDPDEPFDVTPYAEAAFRYFLRNPICQEMGRKIKPAFSSSDKDSAFTYFHDFGFIPRIRVENGVEKRGFKVVVGGGLGAISIVAKTAYEFLEADHIIPFMEAAIRVFDRYGEREKRMKARMKFLIQKIGFEEFMNLVELEKIALKNRSVPIDYASFPQASPAPYQVPPTNTPIDANKYERWLITNVYEQKQQGYFAAQLRVPLGNISAPNARSLAALVRKYAADDIRVTVNQGLLLKFLRKESLPYLFNELQKLGLAEPGFDTIADITACPGTDTCALGVTNSTGLAEELEKVIQEEYPDLIVESDIKIKISGCMNSCGQHMAAQIGFHGSSIKKGALVIPAMQIVLGGGVSPDGKGFVAEKVIKLPTKRIPEALRYLLEDYEVEAGDTAYFNDYMRRQGKRYFYDLLKPLAEIDTLKETDFFDWGQDQNYIQEIGVGECAGVTLDVVGTIIADSREKIDSAYAAFQANDYINALYHAYTGFVVGAKALLLSKDVKCNTHRLILDDFQTHYVETGDFDFPALFPDFVLQINKYEPTLEFTEDYLAQAEIFVQQVIATRKHQLVAADGAEKLVIDNYYKA
ncbi:MAG: ferredoxin--nitrite reductase [Saprospiraceae bacterium]|nr:MAG: ferredoxin--nitrite reductase [Saprospiraceae bacterium]